MIGGIGRAIRARTVSIAVFISCCLPTPLWAEDPPSLSKAGDELTKAIDAFTKAATVNQVKNAETQVQKALLDAVNSATGKLANYARINLFGAFVNETNSLKDTFDIIQKDDEKLDALRNINRVNATAKDKNDRLLTIDKEHGLQLYAAIGKIREILTAIGPSRRINIVGAWYGDIESIASAQPTSPWSRGSRFCSATAAVQAFCEAQTACFTVQSESGENAKPNATGAKSDRTAANLCGYDPVPYAADDTKALIVIYNCLSLNEEAWRMQDEIVWRKVNWKYRRLLGKGIPADSDAWGSSTDKINPSSGQLGAVLHNGAVGEIRCYRGDLGQ